MDEQPWLPTEWVELELGGPVVKRRMHRSGVEVFHLADGAIVVYRCEGLEAKRVANLLEAELVQTCYVLTDGTNESRTVIYRLPEEKAPGSSL